MAIVVESKRSKMRPIYDSANRIPGLESMEETTALEIRGKIDSFLFSQSLERNNPLPQKTIDNLINLNEKRRLVKKAACNLENADKSGQSVVEIDDESITGAEIDAFNKVLEALTRLSVNDSSDADTKGRGRQPSEENMLAADIEKSLPESVKRYNCATFIADLFKRFGITSSATDIESDVARLKSALDRLNGKR